MSVDITGILTRCYDITKTGDFSMVIQKIRKVVCHTHEELCDVEAEEMVKRERVMFKDGWINIEHLKIAMALSQMNMDDYFEILRYFEEVLFPVYQFPDGKNGKEVDWLTGEVK